MRVMRHLTLCLGAAFALGALAASAAPAALPELGRCLKLEGAQSGHKKTYSGKYTDRKCTKESATSKGKFEWFAGADAGSAKEFETFGLGAQPVTLETATEAGVQCKDHLIEGEYTGPTTAKLKIKLLECLEATSKQSCTSEPPEGPQILNKTIVSQNLEARLGYIKQGGPKPQVGWEYKPETGSDLFVFECGQVPGVGRKVAIEGAFIGQVLKPINKMSEEEFLNRFQGQRGKQIPEMFEGGAKATLTSIVINLSSQEVTSEPIAISAPIEEQSTGESLEIKATP